MLTEYALVHQDENQLKLARTKNNNHGDWKLSNLVFLTLVLCAGIACTKEVIHQYKIASPSEFTVGAPPPPPPANKPLTSPAAKVPTPPATKSLPPQTKSSSSTRMKQLFKNVNSKAGEVDTGSDTPVAAATTPAAASQTTPAAANNAPASQTTPAAGNNAPASQTTPAPAANSAAASQTTPAAAANNPPAASQTTQQANAAASNGGSNPSAAHTPAVRCSDFDAPAAAGKGGESAVGSEATDALKNSEQEQADTLKQMLNSMNEQYMSMSQNTAVEGKKYACEGAAGCTWDDATKKCKTSR